MAQGSGNREPPSVIAPKGEEDAEMSSEPGAFEMSAASLGKRRERRSGVLLAGTGTVAAERFASTLATDSDSGLLEAARATPRRSSIIKDPSKCGRKKTVSFSSMPSEKKISSASDCISFMQAGCELKKVRQNSRIYNRFFTLDPDLQALRWEPSKKDSEKAKLDISAIKEIRLGKNTETFRNNGLADQISEDCAFSIIHGENYESLDLVANSADVANIWVSGLQYLVSRTKQCLDLIESSQNTPRFAWLTSVFEAADIEGNGIMLEDTVVELIKQLNPALKESKIRLKFKEIQRSKEKLTTRVTTEEFCEAYTELCTRPEVYFLLVQISKNKEYVDAKDLMLFLEAEQGVAGVTENICLDIIRRYEFSQEGQLKGFLAIDGFTQYLLSPECDIFDTTHIKVVQDMTQSLSHYYINSSHNTYLIEDQVRGPADINGYIRALKMSCRSIELDVCDGPDNEPIICNCNNRASPLSFKYVIEVINKLAFVSSEYPLILCLQNHCSIQQQKIMAEQMKKTFGTKLYTDAPLPSEMYLPSPEKLKMKIIIKGKKLPYGKDLLEGEVTDEDEEAEISRKKSEEYLGDPKMSWLCKELSDLVTICKSVQFKDFENSMKNQNYWEMCSFSEGEASKIANECPEDFVNYNKRFLSRIYPSAMRIDSSNVNPQDFWNCGCQIVAMNYQTPGPMMDLHTGWFLQNGGCGYVLRPSVMREEVSYFSANTKGIVPGASPQVLHVKIISGQNFPKPKGACAKGDVIDPYVCLEIHGIPADCTEQRTKTVQQNSDNPIFDESFEFEINLPELAMIRFVVLDDDYIGDEFIGQYTIPLECLQSGYRHIPLRSFVGDIMEHVTLFVHIAITNRSGGGKPQKRSLTARMGMKTRDYTMLRNTSLKIIDDIFKLAVHPLREATDLRENMQNSILSVKELCGLPPITSLKQCILTLVSRLVNSDSIPSVVLCMKDNFPYLEPLGTLTDVQKKVLAAYDQMIQESKFLVETADTVYDKIIQCQKAGMELHEELHNLGTKEGLKGRKLSKAIESFAWNITVLKGQRDLLRSAKNEAIENMKQIQLACLSCGLSKSGSGNSDAKAKRGLEPIEKKETSSENARL
ncbi:inactive phospholipase C-like protein 1 isoform X1 [Pantherophis guttatus]|uniref:Phosphoinositide phospholipase C n=1 Tax=Pantherophis guttatus TaxID=94885 RepID=A0A6P9CSI4_PANGU|nr:inactive phospholipase C-like protein 1 isoform X1 [Pantherophis guttatus]